MAGGVALEAGDQSHSLNVLLLVDVLLNVEQTRYDGQVVHQTRVHHYTLILAVKSNTGGHTIVVRTHHGGARLDQSAQRLDVPAPARPIVITAIIRPTSTTRYLRSRWSSECRNRRPEGAAPPRYSGRWWR